MNNEQVELGDKEMRSLQNEVQNFASYLGHVEGLFGMTLADISWADGCDYFYYPKNRKIEEFTLQECLDTLKHIHEWLKSENKHTNIYIK